MQTFAASSARRSTAPRTKRWAASSTCSVGETGQTRAAIIDFGGFLGVGARKIAIDWSTLRFETVTPDAAVVVALDRDEIKAMPQYKESRDVVAVVSNRRDITPNSDG
jgi:hypothetical protein